VNLVADSNPQFSENSVSGPLAASLSILAAKQGSQPLLLAELGQFVRNSRLEVGCLFFDLYRIPARLGAFALYEVWETRERMDIHGRSVHTTKFRTSTEPYLETPIQIFELEELI
jgi:quinol monooxygenase YgiN